MEARFFLARWFVVPVAVSFLAGCVRGEAGLKARNHVAVDVAAVGYDQASGTHYVMLQEKTGSRSLPITIGDDEARAIMFELHGIQPERPLTYQLLRDVIKKTGNHVDGVLIADVENEVYYAKIFLDQGRYAVDCRPSDAIALALGADAPIYVAPKLFQSAGPVSPVAAPLKTAKALGITVEELTDDLAQGFGVPAHSGVVIADLTLKPASAGLERGDIIVQVEGHHVSTTDQFQNAAMGSGGSDIALTIEREGAMRVITVERGAGGRQAKNGG